MCEIIVVPALSDNYIFLIKHSSGNWVVDPGDYISLSRYLRSARLALDYILITHHHYDHVAAVPALMEDYPSAKLVLPQLESKKIIDRGNYPITVSSRIISDFHESSEFPFQVLDLPGHTNGHVGYYLMESNALFCGDVLFSAGCGRVFEGTFEEMFTSLKKISALPQETFIYCAHEYTKANIKFALKVDPFNKNLTTYARLIASVDVTVPTTIKNERLINPFLRTAEYKKNDYFLGMTEFEIFSFLRKEKDQFY